MTKIKLTESVSVSELKHMREVEGLSNAEIAKRVGCAVSTVIAYIGQQPVEMTKRNQMAGMRKTKELPPLTETKTEIPDMPRESFKERCDRLMAQVDNNLRAVDEAREKIKQQAPADPDGEPKKHIHYLTPPKEGWGTDDVEVDPTPRRLEDIAYEVYMKREKEQKKRVAEIIPELLEIFGQDTVRAFLKVNLYFCGIPFSHELKRETMLEALRKLNSKGEPMYD